LPAIAINLHQSTVINPANSHLFKMVLRLRRRFIVASTLYLVVFCFLQASVTRNVNVSFDSASSHPPNLPQTVLISENEISSICAETTAIATQVYNTKSAQNHPEQNLWAQDIPTIHLGCEQLIRSVQKTSHHYIILPMLWK
jgi:hypothetical protein